MRFIFLLLIILLPNVVLSAEVKHITVELHLVDDYSDIPLNYMFGYKDKYYGAAYPYPNGPCVIHVKDPKDAEDKLHLEVLGHELMHCYKGKYHD